MLCPVCKAENASGPNCRRCRADLSLLFSLEEQEQRLLGEARLAAAAGEWALALRRLECARTIRDCSSTRHWRAVCLLMLHEYAAAWHSWETAGSIEPAAGD